MDRCQKTVSPLQQKYPDGKRIGDESEKTRRVGEPQARVVEKTAAGLYRKDLFKAIRQR